MARTISIFFSPPDQATDCRGVLEELLGLSFHLESDDGLARYTTRCLGLELIWFNNHGLVNDSGIPFDNYEYQFIVLIIGNKIDATIAEAHRRSASHYLFRLFADVLCWESALVDNLQQLIAIYPPTTIQALE